MEAVLPPVRLERGQTVLEGTNAGIRLRRFQEEVLDFFLSDNRSLVLKAPTGSGKTLTVLLPLAARLLSGREYYGVLAVYPTKALVEDQYLSVKSVLERLGAVARYEANYLVADVELRVRRQGVARAGRWRVALAKLTRENVDRLAELLGGGDQPRRQVLNRFVEQLAGVHRVDYVVVFAVPEYPYLLATRLYSNPRAWRLLDKAATGELIEVARLYSGGDAVKAHRRAREIAGGSYLGKVLYDVLAGLGNVLFLDEFHVWRGLERPTVAAMAALVSTISRIHLIDERFVFSSATPVELPGFVRKALEPIVEVRAEPSPSGDVIRGSTRLRIVRVSARGGGPSAWMQTDSSLPSLVKEHLDCLKAAGRFMVIGRRNYYVEKAAETFHKLTGAEPVIVNGVEPPSWARGREALPGLRTRGALPLFGNFAVELGIDLGNIRCGIVTAAVFGELVQRMGRIGRGNVDSTILVPVPEPYFDGVAARLEKARSYPEALEAFRAFMEDRLAVEEAYEKALPLRRIAEARMLIPLALATLSLIASDKYQDRAYREAIEGYLQRLEELWSRVGQWLSTRVSRNPHVLLALASFRVGLQVRYRRNGREDYASLSTLLANYSVEVEGDTIVIRGPQRSRAGEAFTVYSEAFLDEWEALYDSILPAGAAAELGKLSKKLGKTPLAQLLGALSDPVYVAAPSSYMEVMKAYGQAVEVKPARGQEPLAYLVLL